jgi:hypothetical protein
VLRSVRLGFLSWCQSFRDHWNRNPKPFPLPIQPYYSLPKSWRPHPSKSWRSFSKFFDTLYHRIQAVLHVVYRSNWSETNSISGYSTFIAGKPALCVLGFTAWLPGTSQCAAGELRLRTLYLYSMNSHFLGSEVRRANHPCVWIGRSRRFRSHKKLGTLVMSDGQASES